jgi:hypothetical protein
MVPRETGHGGHAPRASRSATARRRRRAIHRVSNRLGHADLRTMSRYAAEHSDRVDDALPLGSSAGSSIRDNRRPKLPSIEQTQRMSTPGKAGPEQLPDGPGVAVLVIRMPSGVRPPTGESAAMIAWLFRHGAPRTGEVLRRLERHAWTLGLPDPAASTQSALWASARFAGIAEARAAARPFQGRVEGVMRWTPSDRPAERMSVPVTEPPGPHRA